MMHMMKRHLKFVQGLARCGQIFTASYGENRRRWNRKWVWAPISVYIFAKRHTACRVASTHCAVWLGVTPQLSWPETWPGQRVPPGYSSPWPQRVTSILTWNLTLMGGYPQLPPIGKDGVSPVRKDKGTPLGNDWEPPSGRIMVTLKRDMGPVEVLWDGVGVPLPPSVNSQTDRMHELSTCTM